ncbi:transcriptional regulator, XRE family [Cellulomonas flavigena DSM 20109]|uniref:Transcriptional regulator, XRE family n=1 Tax=Cellulomonas flavigena (strain ATCC 482 / DSM 20109 / BCRC 11376 / JCM 18109 / NBRC 3775 / NCIMB 8073 / NRS 134) TaxID=446466 RepID=D5UH82_CELFN|nr:helix-turn-helix transcriptional regulator [Cellulomonas flavigena]ADG73285.1 transcriptional regulator, XRE family [Cellulomonas flavigena DSM 20109]
MGRDRAALAEFLRSRRDRLTPRQAGITPSPGERRVPGLRRQELAQLAGLSVDYYNRLEQGRQANISREVLDALARALRLDDVERAHLDDLAAPASPRARATTERPQRPDPGLLRVTSMLDHLPVVVIGRRGTVLARNALFSAVYGHPMEPGTCYTRYLLLDPDARDRIIDWEACARAAVAGLRREVARRPQDHRLRQQIDELCRADADVARWWDDHRVSEYSSAPRRIRHPVAGDLSFDVELLVAPQEPDQHLVLYTVEPHSRTARTLPLLAAGGAGPAAGVVVTDDAGET